MTVLSTSVLSPSVTRRTGLPVMSATSRTMRGMRWNTDFTGCARIAMTLSWISRVSCSQLVEAHVDDGGALRARFSMTLCDSIAWLMTSSPTRSIRRSTRSRSTRIVVAGGGVVLRSCAWPRRSLRGGRSRLRRAARRRRPAAPTLLAISAAATAASTSSDAASASRRRRRHRRRAPRDRTGPGSSAARRQAGVRRPPRARLDLQLAIAVRRIRRPRGSPSSPLSVVSEIVQAR